MKLTSACTSEDVAGYSEQFLESSAVQVEDGPFLLATCADTPQPTSDVAQPTRLHARDIGLAARTLDILVALALIVFVAPLMLACVVAVRCSGPGPIFFRQTRIGRGGDRFLCLKFRTMRVDAEAAIASVLLSSIESQHEWLTVRKLSRDPRVTPIGAFLRRYCLDELPQLFNVLAGQMSVVGPRPIVAEEISKYGENFADYCSVNPGLTGLWQISGRHALSYEERVALDARYARSKSLQADLLILCRTVPIVLGGKNA